MRFLHGMVRRRLHGKPYWKPKLWDVPVNQEDMMATLLAFSYNVLSSPTLFSANSIFELLIITQLHP